VWLMVCAVSWLLLYCLTPLTVCLSKVNLYTDTLAYRLA
jgi:hypothetical protein